tara:strand:- start:217 stop:507 length:291 start_codon:yes stop_codon:yes gene_type:complete
MKRDFVEDVLTISIIIVFLIVVLMLIWKLSGHSPTLLEMLSMVVVGLVLYTTKVEYSRGKFEGESNEFRRSVRESFDRVKEDMGELKSDVKEILMK